MAVATEVLSQRLRDVAKDNLFSARFIGPSTLNNTRITVNSALTRVNDAVDVFKFRNTRATEALRFAHQATAKLDIELVDRRGKILAKSSATEGILKDNYDKLTFDGLAVAAGDHYIRIRRDKSIDKKAVVEYFFQIENGKFNTEYDTQETPPPRPAPAIPVGTQTSQNTLQNISYLQESLLGSDNFFTKLKSVYGSIISIDA